MSHSRVKNAADEYVRIAKTLYDTGYNKEAIEVCNIALSINAESSAAYCNRGQAYYALHNYEQAILDYKKSLELHPLGAKVHKVHNSMGRALAALERYDEALSEYEIAIDMNPHHAKTYLNKGKTFSILKRHDEALAAYQIALTLDSKLHKDVEALVLQEEVRWTMQKLESIKIVSTEPDSALMVAPESSSDVVNTMGDE